MELTKVEAKSVATLIQMAAKHPGFMRHIALDRGLAEVMAKLYTEDKHIFDAPPPEPTLTEAQIFWNARREEMDKREAHIRAWQEALHATCKQLGKAVSDIPKMSLTSLEATAAAKRKGKL